MRHSECSFHKSSCYAEALFSVIGTVVGLQILMIHRVKTADTRKYVNPRLPVKEKRVASNTVHKEIWLSPSSVFGESTFVQEVDLFPFCRARWHTLHCGWQCSGGIRARRSRWEVLSELQDHVQICPDSCTENQSGSIFFIFFFHNCRRLVVC